MKANELRIGNLLQCEPISNVNQGIYSDGVMAITGYGIHMMEIMGLDYKPIPLTEEWLVKFGLDKIDNEIGLWRNGDAIYFNYGYEKSVELKYVHSLQNLFFALTGEELEINKGI